LGASILMSCDTIRAWLTFNCFSLELEFEITRSLKNVTVMTYHYYVITFWVITPLKRNSPIQKKLFLSCQIIDLEFVYPNLLFKVLYDDYWDCYKHITGHYRSFLVYWQSRKQCILSFYIFRVITLPTRGITNIITVMIITVILGNFG